MTYTALPGSARRGRLAFACVAAVACAGLASRRGGPAAPAAASSLKSDPRGGTRITTDDDTDDRTVYNPTLHVYRDHHHTAHHHSLTKNPEKTWTTDDRSHDDDDVMGYDARGAGAGVLNHTYCGLVLTKNTQSSSNATGTFAWFVDFLDAFCQSLEDCHIGCEKCGFALRAALPADNASSHSCFGLHVVDARARGQGPVPFDEMVATFEAGLGDFSNFSAFMDQSTALYAEDATPYARRFAAAGAPHLVLAWTSERGVPLYSVFAHVPYTLGVLEIVTPRLAPELAARATRAAAEARFPDSAFAIANVNLSLPVAGARASSVLRPLAVSKVTSDMAAVARCDARDLDLEG